MFSAHLTDEPYKDMRSIPFLLPCWALTMALVTERFENDVEKLFREE